MGLLLFQWSGYQILYGVWMQQADDRLETRLDKQAYDSQDLITVAIPMHLPYITDQQAFERCNGEINLNGISYKYVQRRVFHDSLILLCLPDKERMQLAIARNNFFSSSIGIQQKGTGLSQKVPAASRLYTNDEQLLRNCQPPVIPSVHRCPYMRYSQAYLPGISPAGPDQPPEQPLVFA